MATGTFKACPRMRNGVPHARHPCPVHLYPEEEAVEMRWTQTCSGCGGDVSGPVHYRATMDIHREEPLQYQVCGYPRYVVEVIDE